VLKNLLIGLQFIEYAPSVFKRVYFQIFLGILRILH
jgi:hypothetical protein